MCDIDGQGQHLTAAAIIGHDGSVWAQSAAFPQVLILFQAYSSSYCGLDSFSNGAVSDVELWSFILWKNDWFINRLCTDPDLVVVFLY